MPQLAHAGETARLSLAGEQQLVVEATTQGRSRSTVVQLMRGDEVISQPTLPQRIVCDLALLTQHPGAKQPGTEPVRLRVHRADQQPFTAGFYLALQITGAHNPGLDITLTSVDVGGLSTVDVAELTLDGDVLTVTRLADSNGTGTTSRSTATPSTDTPGSTPANSATGSAGSAGFSGFSSGLHRRPEQLVRHARNRRQELNLPLPAAGWRVVVDTSASTRGRREILGGLAGLLGILLDTTPGTSPATSPGQSWIGAPELPEATAEQPVLCITDLPFTHSPHQHTLMVSEQNLDQVWATPAPVFTLHPDQAHALIAEPEPSGGGFHSPNTPQADDPAITDLIDSLIDFLTAPKAA